MKPTALFLYLILFFVTTSDVFADLRPVYFTVEISATKSKFTQSEMVQLNVSLKNIDINEHSILIPGNQSKGKKLIYFSWYKVDNNNFYTEVYRDSRVISMDTSVKGFVSFKRLNPGESISIPIFFNDAKNAKRHIYSHYETPKLPPGKYKIIAWYYPWDEELAKYVFNKFDFKGRDLVEDKNPELLDLSESGTQSTYFDVEIVSEKQVDLDESYTKECPKNCKLCHAIAHGNWRKVERIIRRQSSFRKEKGKPLKHHFGNWYKNHRNVAFYGPYPDGILLTLPTSTGIEIVFKNKKGYHYFYLNWQLGKIKPINSQLNRLWQLCFHRCCPLKSSKVRYTILKSMNAW